MLSFPYTKRVLYVFTNIQKERGNLPVTRPTHRGSGIALVVERATPKPTPICIYGNAGYYIPIGVIVALFLTTRWNCQIPMRQAQSADNAFPIYRSPPKCPTVKRGFGMKTQQR